MDSIFKQITDTTTINRLVALGLGGIGREYPNNLERFWPGQRPREVHPAFYGCYDWHSAVHTHWMLVRLLRSFPGLVEATAVRAALDANLTVENISGETANFGEPGQPEPDNWIVANSKPGQPAFERPYGWGWLLQLAAELQTWDDADGLRWSRNLQPLTQRITELFSRFLAGHQPPHRDGQHRNTAFALALALDYTHVCHRPELERQIIRYSLDFYGKDKKYSTKGEPGPTDFCSPSLAEANLMARILARPDFTEWFDRFLLGIGRGRTAALLRPAVVADHHDPFISHLDGLNLHRAWCMERIAKNLPEDSSARPVLLEAAHRHAEAGLSAVFAGDYGSSGHWLGTFVVYLLGESGLSMA